MPRDQLLMIIKKIAQEYFHTPFLNKFIIYTYFGLQIKL